MKKWAPYKSLDAQADYLEKMAYDKGKSEKPLLAEEAIEEIEAILAAGKGALVRIRYYEDGYIHERKGRISEIDPIYRSLKISGERLYFDNIVGIAKID
jgi:hypothetical protein